MSGDQILIPTDDAPAGEGTSLAIFGDEDWYVGVLRPGDRVIWDAVRFCTSGARNPALTMTVAIMHAIASGQTDVAISRTLSLLRTLTDSEMSKGLKESAGDDTQDR